MPKYVISTDGHVATGTAAKTHLQLVTPATRRVQPTHLVIGFDGATSSAVPGAVDLVRQTTAGTASGVTPVLVDPAETASLCTGCQRGFSGTEPTYTDYVYRTKVTAYGGTIHLPLEDLDIWVAAGTRLGLVLTYAATVNAVSSLYFRE